MIVLPFEPSRGAYEFTTRLPDGSDSGAEYRFAVRWNAHRLGGWYFDVYDEAGAPIASGLKIVLGCWIGKTVMHPLFDRGAFMAIDTTRSGRDAGFDDLGTRVEVRYFTLTEIAIVNTLAANTRS